MVTGIGFVTIHGASVMLDKTKGSMTNRYQCAKEQIKNDLKMGLSIAVPSAAVATAAIAKPSILTTLATGTGKVISKVAQKLTGKGLNNVRKAGAIGLAIAGGAYLIDRIGKYLYKAGQIDQKYTDSALIESTTKNVILDNPRKCSHEEIKEYYNNGGKGIHF